LRQDSEVTLETCCRERHLMVRQNRDDHVRCDRKRETQMSGSAADTGLRTVVFGLGSMGGGMALPDRD